MCFLGPSFLVFPIPGSGSQVAGSRPGIAEDELGGQRRPGEVAGTHAGTRLGVVVLAQAGAADRSEDPLGELPCALLVAEPKETQESEPESTPATDDTDADAPSSSGEGSEEKE